MPVLSLEISHNSRLAELVATTWRLRDASIIQGASPNYPYSLPCVQTRSFGNSVPPNWYKPELSRGSNPQSFTATSNVVLPLGQPRWEPKNGNFLSPVPGSCYINPYRGCSSRTGSGLPFALEIPHNWSAWDFVVPGAFCAYPEGSVERLS